MGGSSAPKPTRGKPGPSWQLIAGISLVLVLMALLPLMDAGLSLNDYGVPNRTFILVWLHRQAWGYLIFPLLVGLSFGLELIQVTGDRHLFLTRTRRPARITMIRQMLWAMTVAGVTFAAAGAILSVAAAVMPVAFMDDALAAIDRPELMSTFSQLAAIHPALYFMWLPVWLGLNAAIYAVISWSSLVLIRQRFLALIAPWLVWFALYFGMALIGLEKWSPNTIFPFNLTQLPMYVPLVPLVLAAAVAIALATVVLSKADRLWVTQ